VQKAPLIRARIIARLPKRAAEQCHLSSFDEILPGARIYFSVTATEARMEIN